MLTRYMWHRFRPIWEIIRGLLSSFCMFIIFICSITFYHPFVVIFLSATLSFISCWLFITQCSVPYNIICYLIIQYIFFLKLECTLYRKLHQKHAFVSFSLLESYGSDPHYSLWFWMMNSWDLLQFLWHSYFGFKILKFWYLWRGIFSNCVCFVIKENMEKIRVECEPTLNSFSNSEWKGP